MWLRRLRAEFAEALAQKSSAEGLFNRLTAELDAERVANKYLQERIDRLEERNKALLQQLAAQHNERTLVQFT